jgi:putative ABC transport system substrate-binding protein
MKKLMQRTTEHCGRRRLLATAAILGLARSVQAQTPTPRPLIGFLNSSTPGPFAHLVDGFRRGLTEMGFAEKRNIDIEYRWAEGAYERLPALAAELLQRNVSVLVATGGEFPALAAKRATSTVPIVFAIGDDPVRVGLVESLGRPGGNLTGVTQFTSQLESKRLGLLIEVAPAAKMVGVLVNPRNVGAEGQIEELTAAARSRGLRLEIARAETAADFEGALGLLARSGVQALQVAADPYFNSNRQQLIAQVSALGVPAIYEFREFVTAGGLMSYGNSLAEGYRQVGIYTGRILRGVRTTDLPVLQPTRFELVINLGVAARLGIAVPQAVLARADELIE